MAKRKAPEATKPPPPDANDSGSDDDASMLDVDFEWFSPAPIDFHGLKTLLRQLFDADADLLDLSALSDLILSQPDLGSTVKCDGEESDPFAFLTVLNLRQHAAVPAVQALVRYMVSRAETNEGLRGLVEVLRDEKAEVGLVFSERLINMPTEIVPPMYNMLAEEVEAAVEEGEPCRFSHYLVLSKTYAEVVSELVTEDRPKKKSKQNGAGPETFYFHAEDEVLERFAVAKGGWDYEKVSEGGADAKRAFQEAGIKPSGHAVLIESGRFKEAVKAVGEYLGGPAA